MYEAFANLNKFKSVMAYEFFIQPADQNYILARWMLIQGFYPEFFWQALQAVEKYLKAGLILQDNAANDGHDIAHLYQKHILCFQDLAFTSFHKPSDLNGDIWRDVSVNSYIDTLNSMGQTNSRYGLVSWWRREDDLFKFDQVCWNLRRLTIGLNWQVGADFEIPADHEPYRGRSYQSVLMSYPEFQPRGDISSLGKSLVDVGVTRADLLHAWNFAYRRDCSDTQKPAPSSVSPPFGPMKNSYFYLLYESLTRSNDRADIVLPPPEFIDGMRWVGRFILTKKRDREHLEKILGDAISVVQG